MRVGPQRCALVLAICWLIAPTARAAESDAFAAAADHYRHGRWQQACDAFAELLQTDPQFARRSDAHFFYGEALVQLDRWQEARPHFAKVLELDARGPRAQQSLFRVGEAAYMLGDDAAAQRDLAEFAERYPDDPLNAYALAYLGGLTLQADTTAAAEKWFREALQRYPDGPMAAESQFGLAQAEHLAGKLQEARDAYQATVTKGGELAEPALAQLGAIENVLGDHQAALAALDEFAQKYPHSQLLDKAQLGRGYALLKLGQPGQAQQALQPLAGKSDTQVEASYYLALTQAAEGQWQAAAETLKRIPVDPDHALAPAVTYHIADALSHSGNLEAARQQFDQLLQSHPDSIWTDDALLGKLRLAVEGRDAASSLELADALLAKYPDSPLASQARLAKGQALAMLDRPEEAVDALTSLLNIDPASVPNADELRTRAQGLLAVSQAQLGKFDQAQQALSELAKKGDTQALVDEAKLRVGELAQSAGQQPLAQQLLAGVTEGSQQIASRARSSMAWNHFENKRWADAADAFEQVLASEADPALAAEAGLLRGRALEHLNQPQDALAMYDQVVAKFPESTRAAEAMLHAARLNEQLGSTEAASRGYRTLIEAHPDFAHLDEAIYRQAWLLQQSDPAAAKQLFERLRNEFATSPLVADATLRLAETAVETHDFDSATTLLREITRPDAPAEIRPQSLYLAGRMEMVRGEWLSAQRPLMQLVREHPDSDFVLPAEYLLGEASFRLGEFQPAAERLAAVADKAAERNEPWLPTAELRRAQSLAQLRRWDEAKEVAAGIPARFPQFAGQFEVDYLMGRICAAQANFDDARSWYAKAIAAPQAANTETAAMAQWMIGESFFHQEKYPEAAAEYLRVSDQYPRWHAAAMLQAGKAEEALGHFDAAAEHYQRLLQLYPDGALSAEATRRLEAARQSASSAPTARK